MKTHVYEGKNIEELKKKALDEINKPEEDLIIKDSEEEVGLFKAKKVKIEILEKDDVIEYTKELLNNITNQMGLNVNLESKKRAGIIKINLFSDNNAILIGKGGKTIEALQTIVKHSILSKTGFYVNVIIDVEDYKEKQHRNIEYFAKKTAKEVIATGVEAKLENMNSYERRLVHEVLSSIPEVYTVSEGEEPNRHVIIRLRNE